MTSNVSIQDSKQYSTALRGVAIILYFLITALARLQGLLILLGVLASLCFWCCLVMD